jgi:hypothetical protein
VPWRRTDRRSQRGDAEQEDRRKRDTAKSVGVVSAKYDDTAQKEIGRLRTDVCANMAREGDEGGKLTAPAAPRAGRVRNGGGVIECGTASMRNAMMLGNGTSQDVFSVILLFVE